MSCLSQGVEGELMNTIKGLVGREKILNDGKVKRGRSAIGWRGYGGGGVG